MNTRNSDFGKIANSGFRAISPVLARHMPPSFPYLLFYYITFDHNNLNLPFLPLHTVHPSTIHFGSPPLNDVCEEV